MGRSQRERNDHALKAYKIFFGLDKGEASRPCFEAGTSKSPTALLKEDSQILRERPTLIVAEQVLSERDSCRSAKNRRVQNWKATVAQAASKTRLMPGSQGNTSHTLVKRGQGVRDRFSASVWPSFEAVHEHSFKREEYNGLLKSIWFTSPDRVNRASTPSMSPSELHRS